MLRLVAMRSVSAVLAGTWLALLLSPPLLTGCANILGLDGYRPDPEQGGSDPGGDPLGAPCESGDTCESGFCSDELCCDRACDGVCDACDITDFEGTCSPREAGTTFIGCTGVCDGDGGCLVDGGTASLAGGPGDQRAYALAAGPSGGFVIAGLFNAAFSFDDNAPMPMPVVGGFDAYVATFDSEGTLGFERSVGGAQSDALYAVDMAADGRVVAAGESRSPAFQFAGMPRSFNAVGDPLIVAWDPAGTELWLAAPSQSVNVSEVAYGVAFDDEGRVWAGGNMTDADGLGLSDGFVNVYDAAGSEAFPPIRLGVDGFTSYVRTLGANEAGDRVLVAGTTDGPLNVAAVSEVGVGPDPDMFLIMFDSSGTPLWGHAYPASSGGAIPVSVAFDADGGVAVSGIAVGNNDFGGSILQGIGMDEDIFIASFTEDGEHRFSHVYPAVGFQIGRSIAFDASGRLVVAGESYGAFEFGPEAPLLGVVGGSDGYVGRLTADGEHLASFSFGDVVDQQIWGVATASDGVVRLAGYAAGAFDLFESPLTAPDEFADVLLMNMPP